MGEGRGGGEDLTWDPRRESGSPTSQAGGETREYSASKRGIPGRVARRTGDVARSCRTSSFGKESRPEKIWVLKGISLPFTPDRTVSMHREERDRNDTYTSTHTSLDERATHTSTWLLATQGCGTMQGCLDAEQAHPRRGRIDGTDGCKVRTEHLVFRNRTHETNAPWRDAEGTGSLAPSTNLSRDRCVASDPHVRRFVPSGTDPALRRIAVRVQRTCTWHPPTLALASRPVLSKEFERSNRREPRRGIHSTTHVRCSATEGRSLPSNVRTEDGEQARAPRSSADAKARRTIAVDRTALVRHTLLADTLQKSPSTPRGASARMPCNCGRPVAPLAPRCTPWFLRFEPACIWIERVQLLRGRATTETCVLRAHPSSRCGDDWRHD